MPSSVLWKLCAPGLILLLPAAPQAAERPLPPSAPQMENLHSLTRRSGYIFAGTVKAVEHIAPTGGHAVGVMRITFQVDSGIRGVRKGQKLVIREWAGLWELGERYRPGERVLLFLYPPSKLGLTSPVGGAMGRFPVDRDGQIVPPRARMGGPGPIANRPERFSPKISLRELTRALRKAGME